MSLLCVLDVCDENSQPHHSTGICGLTSSIQNQVI